MFITKIFALFPLIKHAKLIRHFKTWIYHKVLKIPWIEYVVNIALHRLDTN